MGNLIKQRIFLRQAENTRGLLIELDGSQRVMEYTDFMKSARADDISLTVTVPPNPAGEAPRPNPAAAVIELNINTPRVKAEVQKVNRDQRTGAITGTVTKVQYEE